MNCSNWRCFLRLVDGCRLLEVIQNFAMKIEKLKRWGSIGEKD